MLKATLREPRNEAGGDDAPGDDENDDDSDDSYHGNENQDRGDETAGTSGKNSRQQSRSGHAKSKKRAEPDDNDGSGKPRPPKGSRLHQGQVPQAQQHGTYMSPKYRWPQALHSPAQVSSHARIRTSMKAGSHPGSHERIDPALFDDSSMIAPLSGPNPIVSNGTHQLHVGQGSAEHLQLDGIRRRITW